LSASTSTSLVKHRGRLSTLDPCFVEASVDGSGGAAVFRGEQWGAQTTEVAVDDAVVVEVERGSASSASCDAVIAKPSSDGSGCHGTAPGDLSEALGLGHVPLAQLVLIRSDPVRWCPAALDTQAIEAAIDS
jgi:hypothetical protein